MQNDESSATTAVEDRRRRRRSRLTWTVPVAAVAVVGLGTAAFAVAPQLTAATTPPAPPVAQLLADIAGAHAQPFSGTVVETADLGIPALPGSGSSTSLTSLLSGSHTLRVWSDAATRQRVAVIGDLAETDVIHNGTDGWIWYSSSNSAEHLLLPSKPAAGASPSPSPDPTGDLTPAAAAAEFLAEVGPTTVVTVAGTTTVAGRPAYLLQMTPKDTRSLVDHVTIAVDASTFMPLRVQVFATDGGGPAFSTGYSTFTTGMPDASIFVFTPPPGATVTTKDLRSEPTPHPTGSAPAGDHPVVTGTGWTSVVEVPAADLAGISATGAGSTGSSPATGPAKGSATTGHRRAASPSGELSTLLAAATPVSGSFGSGSVLTTRLVSVLILDDGRVFAGAVAPALLEQAASK